MSEEWCIVADRGGANTQIIRSGYSTAREAGAERAEIERHMREDDTSNMLLMERKDAELFIARTHQL